jgi:hypothetical protein
MLQDCGRPRSDPLTRSFYLLLDSLSNGYARPVRPPLLRAFQLIVPAADGVWLELHPLWSARAQAQFTVQPITHMKVLKASP